MSRFVLPVTTLLLPLILALVVACGNTAPSQQAKPAPAAAAAPAPAPTAAVQTQPSIIPASFFLEVTAPDNEAVVTVSHLPVQGQTATDAVATVNGQVVEVDAQGQFLTEVTLEEGPNLIEVLVSDFEGHQQGQTLTVIYIPQPAF
jgi:hypothetical protein